MSTRTKEFLAVSPSNAPRRAVAVLSVTALACAGISLPLAAQAAVSVDAPVIINEVYGGGGNGGSTYTHDFVELYNPGDEAVSLDGWSLQYASSAGSSYTADTLTGTIQPGEYFLVQQAQGAGGTTPLPTPDDTGTLALSGSGGKIALVSSTTPLAGSTGNAAGAESVVDFVGWGPSASDFAGTGPAPGTSNPTSVSRGAENTNTADNAADFTAGAPTPTASTGGSTDPDPDPDPEPEPEPAVATIAEIQGTGAASPFVGQTVTTRGVVTATYPTGGFNGLVIQTPGTGGAIDVASHTASHAVFVYAKTPIDAQIGDYLEVTGAVSEYFGLTEISAAGADVTVLDEVVTAPVAADVAWPATDDAREVLESMLVAPMGVFTVSNTYATNQWGEVGLAVGTTPLVQPTEVGAPGSTEAAQTAASNAARGVILDDGASTNFLLPENSGFTPPYISLTEPIVVGATVQFTEPVIVDFRNNNWKLNPTTPLVGDGTGDDHVVFSSARTEAPASVGGDLSVASFNVLNYFTTLGVENSSCQAYTDREGNPISVRTGCDQRGAWNAENFQRQQDKIVEAINALDADVVGLMEIENSAALGEPADEATATLVEALNAAAGEERWAYVASSDDLPAIELQDVITNAVIYQPAAVATVGDALALGTESDADGAFGNAREPIGQVFTPAADEAEPFLFVVNHFKSKSSPGPWAGDADQGDGQGAGNVSRVKQAEALAAWVESIQGDVEAVVLAGDFNSYGQEDPMQVLYGAGYTNAAAALGIDDFSYSYQGLSGSLDHVLLNDAALTRATGGDIWSINSGEAVALEYSRYNAHGTLFYAADAYRSSDHDPVKVGLTATQPPVELTFLGINDFHGRIDASTVKFAGTVETLRAEADGPVLFLSSGDNIGASLFASAVAQDQPTIDVLNALELLTSAVGNHEFDRGWTDLRDRVVPASDFSHLGANVYLAGTDTVALDEYALFEADGVTVGVIGAVTEETPSLVSPGGIVDLAYGDPVEAVNRVAAQLSDGDDSNGEADVIVALYHEGAGAGTPDGSTLEEEVAAGGAFAEIITETTAEVDAIFTGHTHKEYAWSAEIPGTDRTRPVVQTGSYGAHIGEIVLTVDRGTGEVLAHTERNVDRVGTADDELAAAFPRVAEVKAIVDGALSAAAEVGNTAVAEVSADITTAHAGGSFVDGVWTGGSRDDRASESTLGNLVANAIKDSLSSLPNGAVIGVTNSGGLRAELWDTQAEFGDTAVTTLPDGTISFSQANAVLPFNNTMALTTLTGAQFTTLLEQQWQRTDAGTVPSRPYLQLGLSDNVTYTYDPALPEGSRITSVTIDGQPLDPAAEYRIGTLSFLATGGDNFHAFKEGTDYVDTGLLDYEAWVDYLADSSPVAPSYAKVAVQVSGVPDAVTAGDTVAFEVAGVNLTSRGAPENTSLTVWHGDTELGTFPVTDGAASIAVTLPAGTPAGATALTLRVEPSGTTVTVPLNVEAPVAQVQTTTSLLPLLPVHINGLLPTTLVAIVGQDGGGTVQGTVEFREGGADGKVIATSTVNSNGIATHRLGRLSRGLHQYTAVFVPSNPTEVVGSHSARTPVIVLF